jgi:predicted  nucleic acid-binding Zn-ribbon protein
MLQGSALEEERSSWITKQASLENEIKQLKQQLSNNSEKETETKRRLEGMLDLSPNCYI